MSISNALYSGHSDFPLKTRPPKRKLAAASIAFCLAAGILCGLGIYKYVQIRRAQEAASKFQLPPAVVTSMTTRQEEWVSILNSVGSLQAVNGVTVSADLPGIVESIHFASGTEVKQGDLLVKLDTRQEEAQLIAAKAKQDLAAHNLKRAQELYMKNVSAHSEYDAAVAAFQENVGNVKEIETQIARKTIRAPFSGLLGIRQVNMGQYLQSGDKIVSLQSLNPIYANFSLPQANLVQLQKAKQVLVYAEGTGTHPYEGIITALDSIIDNSTANLKAQATVLNKNGLLRPGMFVHIEVRLPMARKVIAVPVSAISYSPYGDSIFVIQPRKGRGLEVTQRFVKLGETRGDRVVIESGLDVGKEVATSRIFSLRSGSVVRIDNLVQPSNQLSPQPEDN